MSDQGKVTIIGEEKLAKFVAVLIENSTALFNVKPVYGEEDHYEVTFNGGY
jgi:hypothetical protein